MYITKSFNIPFLNGKTSNISSLNHDLLEVKNTIARNIDWNG